MGDIVNRTWEAAARWQRQVVWFRINAGYIRAELRYLSGTGETVADIEQVVREFDAAFAIFCDEEMAAFVAARQVEAETITRDDFVAKVRALGGCFWPWLEKYHAAVQVRRAANDHSLGVNLLMGCGSELMNAQRRFADAVDAFAGSV
jgi:hypothetical protein